MGKIAIKGPYYRLNTIQVLDTYKNTRVISMCAHLYNIMLREFFLNKYERTKFVRECSI